MPAAARERFRFLDVSTDEVYGTLAPEDPAFHETTPFRPNSPYAASKAAADHMARAWAQTYGLPVMVSHSSNNYGPWQLRSTLLMRWPGRKPQVYTHRSAHQDLPGTLLQEVFGCANPVSDYSSGGNLFDGKSWDWIIAGSYSDYAIVEPDKLIVTWPGGLVDVLGPDYRPKSGIRLNPATI